MGRLLERLPSTFTTREALSTGVHPRDLYGWRDSGQVIELSRGVFRRSDAPLASYPDELAVTRRIPTGVICCVSAASIWGLSDEIPISVQIAVAKGSHIPKIDFPIVSVLQFNASNFELGVTSFEAAPGESALIYNQARTVVDLMRLRHRFGGPVAYSALRRYLDSRGAKPRLLLEYADALRAFGPMRRALDVVMSQ